MMRGVGVLRGEEEAQGGEDETSQVVQPPLHLLVANVSVIETQVNSEVNTHINITVNQHEYYIASFKLSVQLHSLSCPTSHFSFTFISVLSGS